MDYPLSNQVAICLNLSRSWFIAWDKWTKTCECSHGPFSIKSPPQPFIKALVTIVYLFTPWQYFKITCKHHTAQIILADKVTRLSEVQRQITWDHNSVNREEDPSELCAIHVAGIQLACSLEHCWGENIKLCRAFRKWYSILTCITYLVSNVFILPWHHHIQENKQFPVHIKHKVALLQLC